MDAFILFGVVGFTGTSTTSKEIRITGTTTAGGTWVESCYCCCLVSSDHEHHCDQEALVVCNNSATITRFAGTVGSAAATKGLGLWVLLWCSLGSALLMCSDLLSFTYADMWLSLVSCELGRGNFLSYGCFASGGLKRRRRHSCHHEADITAFIPYDFYQPCFFIPFSWKSE